MCVVIIFIIITIAIATIIMHHQMLFYFLGHRTLRSVTERKSRAAMMNERVQQSSQQSGYNGTPPLAPCLAPCLALPSLFFPTRTFRRSPT